MNAVFTYKMGKSYLTSTISLTNLTFYFLHTLFKTWSLQCSFLYKWQMSLQSSTCRSPRKFQGNQPLQTEIPTKII